MRVGYSFRKFVRERKVRRSGDSRQVKQREPREIHLGEGTLAKLAPRLGTYSTS